jgi:hypothetical protein
VEYLQPKFDSDFQPHPDTVDSICTHLFEHQGPLEASQVFKSFMLINNTGFFFDNSQ